MPMTASPTRRATFSSVDEKNLDEMPVPNSAKDEEMRDGQPPYSPGDSTNNLGPISDSTRRKLKPRHIQLIGIGGTIGTALYVQIGEGLLNGGPGSLFIAFTLW